ncbi:TetR/AcrR family transcriptional regulator [Nonomuraea soli]|uniref:AcrR family transcriptional regulator n=1 Tax=Nonomuraea soli TaxID=1032476 RepID=A0A7W0CPR5_9ACTN|nr:TetR/AcrR family transcriptional regulator [Nonomuraea soli]MBA2894963.1 AcrR family transcriptional regulator [Nonomuraea soli]
MPHVKSRREQYSDATRAALLEAATRRFAERGFAGTSLEDVAADIQATRGAVYHHFGSKPALFEAVAEALESRVMREVAEAAEGARDPWSAAIAATEKFLDWCCDPVYSRVVWQEAPLALGWVRWKELEKEYSCGLIEQFIQLLIDAGEMPPLPLEPMTRITFHMLGAAGMAISEVPEQDRFRVRAEYAETIAHLLKGARR